MSNRKSDEKSPFAGAARIEDAAERAAYLDRACGSDAELRARVERLLAAHKAAASFIERPALLKPAAADSKPVGLTGSEPGDLPARAGIPNRLRRAGAKNRMANQGPTGAVSRVGCPDRSPLHCQRQPAGGSTQVRA